MRTLTIKTPGIPPSMNKYLGNSHSHHIYRRDKEYWQEAIGWLIKAAGWKGPRMDRAEVRLTYHFPDKTRRDPDNFSGKFLSDPLVRMGVIRDDDFFHMRLVIEPGEIDRKNPHVEITVKEID